MTSPQLKALLAAMAGLFALSTAAAAPGIVISGALNAGIKNTPRKITPKG